MTLMFRVRQKDSILGRKVGYNMQRSARSLVMKDVTTPLLDLGSFRASPCKLECSDGDATVSAQLARHA